jgi:hypothetical protein
MRFDEVVWREATRGFSSHPREIATSARAQLERRGVTMAQLRPCLTLGPGGTDLAGGAKLYLPITDEPASRRRFAFVLQLARSTHDGELGWVFVAFRTPPSRCGRTQRLRTSTPPTPWTIPHMT